MKKLGAVKVGCPKFDSKDSPSIRDGRHEIGVREYFIKLGLDRKRLSNCFTWTTISLRFKFASKRGIGQ
jgi:hypothetical protein